MRTKADVVSATLRVLESDGLDGLTMRKVGAAVGVQPGGLYRHFPHKRALLEAVAERLVEGVGDPVPDGHWKEQLATIASRMRARLLAHRDGARVVAGTFVVEPNTFRAAQTALAIVTGAGASTELATRTLLALGHFVLGHCIEEQASADLVSEGAWADKDEALREAGSALTPGKGFLWATPTEEQFRVGVSLILDGLGTQLSHG